MVKHNRYVRVVIISVLAHLMISEARVYANAGAPLAAGIVTVATVPFLKRLTEKTETGKPLYREILELALAPAVILIVWAALGCKIGSHTKRIDTVAQQLTPVLEKLGKQEEALGELQKIITDKFNSLHNPEAESNKGPVAVIIDKLDGQLSKQDRHGESIKVILERLRSLYSIDSESTRAVSTEIVHQPGGPHGVLNVLCHEIKAQVEEQSQLFCKKLDDQAKANNECIGLIVQALQALKTQQEKQGEAISALTKGLAEHVTKLGTLDEAIKKLNNGSKEHHEVIALLASITTELSGTVANQENVLSQLSDKSESDSLKSQLMMAQAMTRKAGVMHGRGPIISPLTQLIQLHPGYLALGNQSNS